MIFTKIEIKNETLKCVVMAEVGIGFNGEFHVGEFGAFFQHHINHAAV